MSTDLVLVDEYLQISTCRNYVQEIMFKKLYSRNYVQEIIFKKLYSEIIFYILLICVVMYKKRLTFSHISILIGNV